MYEDLPHKYQEVVTDQNTVLKETISAYNNTILVLLQTYSIVSTAAISGSPKCDDPPKKETYKILLNARDEGIQCLDTARTGILSVAGEAETIKEVKRTHFLVLDRFPHQMLIFIVVGTRRPC